jgi:carbon storage regulator CsrA
MLVLTRKYQEKIRIGDNITITVLRTKGKAVRLGVEAPAEVPVVRGELAFEKAAADPMGSTAPVAAVTANSGRTSRRAPEVSVWSAESPRDGRNLKGGDPAPQVGLKRVPRDKVAEVLPQFITGSRPLRALMDRR